MFSYFQEYTCGRKTIRFKKTAAGLPIFNLEKKRHGKKYFVKAVKEGKNYSFRDILASWTIEVMCTMHTGPNCLGYIDCLFCLYCQKNP